MDYSLNIVSKCHFFVIFKHSRAPKRSRKIFHGVLESLGKVLDFFLSVKECEPWCKNDSSCAMHVACWFLYGALTCWCVVSWAGGGVDTARSGTCQCGTTQRETAAPGRVVDRCRLAVVCQAVADRQSATGPWEDLCPSGRRCMFHRQPFLCSMFVGDWPELRSYDDDNDKVSYCERNIYFPPHIFSVSILTAIFPGGPGLAGTKMSPFWPLLELKLTEVMVTTGAVRRAKLQSNRCHRQTNTVFFSYRPDVLPVTIQ